jgi:hypothetical protein
MTAAAPEHAFRASAAQICEKQAADFVRLALSFALVNGAVSTSKWRLAKRLRAENKALVRRVVNRRVICANPGRGATPFCRTYAHGRAMVID